MARTQIRGDQIKDESLTSADIQDGSLTNSDISNSAAIHVSKLDLVQNVDTNISITASGTGNVIITSPKTLINNILNLNPQASAPGSPSEGDIYANSTDKKLYSYLNSTWVDLTTGAGGSNPILNVYNGSGNATINVESVGDIPELKFKNSINNWTVYVDDSSGNFFIKDDTTDTLPFLIKPTAPSNSFVIDDSGSIGIGVVNPTYTLEVEDSSGTDTAIKLISTTASCGIRLDGALGYFNIYVSGITDVFRIQDEDNSTIPFTIESNCPSNLLYLDDTGRIGINKASPSSVVHAVDSGDAYLEIETTNGSNVSGLKIDQPSQVWVMRSNTSGNLEFLNSTGSLTPIVVTNTAATGTLQLTSSGVAISGTLSATGVATIGATYISSSKIELNQNGSGDRASYIDFHSDDTYSDYSLRIIRNSGANALSQFTHRGTGKLRFYNSEDGNMDFFVNGNQQMQIHSGTVEFNGDLYINNYAIISNDTDGAAGNRSSSNIDHIWHDDDANVWHFVSDGAYKSTGNSVLWGGQINVTNASEDALYCLFRDNTSNNNYRVQIAKNLSGSFLSLYSGSGTNGVILRSYSYPTILGAYDNTTGSAANLNIDSSGNIKRSSSSIRYKTNVRDLELDSNILSSLSVKTFEQEENEINDVTGELTKTNKTRHGFVAEEVVEILPEGVFRDEQGIPEGIEWNLITSLLVDKVKDLMARVEALENQE